MTSTPLFNLFAINGVQRSRTRGARLQLHLIQDSVGGERGIAARDRGRSSRFSGDSSCGPARRVLSAGAAGCAAAGPSPGRVAVGGRTSGAFSRAVPELGGQLRGGFEGAAGLLHRVDAGLRLQEAAVLPAGADPGGQSVSGEASPLLRSAVPLRVSGRNTA